MIGPCGIMYEIYSGKVWVSKQDDQPKQGFNVATLDNGALRVLGYTNRDDAAGRTVDVGVDGILKSYGWWDYVIRRMLASEDELATCSICTRDFHEVDVNLVDYEDDVCIVCELKYKTENQIA